MLVKAVVGRAIIEWLLIMIPSLKKGT